MADENGVTGSSHNHAQHGEPDIREALRGLSAVANAQHVAHCLEHSKGVELGPGIVLWRDKERERENRVNKVEFEKKGGSDDDGCGGTGVMENHNETSGDGAAV